MGENKTTLPKGATSEMLDRIVSIAASTAIEAYKAEQQAEMKKQGTNKKRDTKKLLQSYHRIKMQVEDDDELTLEEKAEYRWKFVEDLMGNANTIINKSERVISDKEKVRQENLYALHRIEKAFEYYKEECNLAGNEEDCRRVRVAQKLYFSDEHYEIKDVAELESVSEKTIYRDIGIIVDILSVYLYGVRIELQNA